MGARLDLLRQLQDEYDHYPRISKPGPGFLERARAVGQALLSIEQQFLALGRAIGLPHFEDSDEIATFRASSTSVALRFVGAVSPFSPRGPLILDTGSVVDYEWGQDRTVIRAVLDVTDKVVAVNEAGVAWHFRALLADPGLARGQESKTDMSGVSIIWQRTYE